jgi:hypothetical protein
MFVGAVVVGVERGYPRKRKVLLCFETKSRNGFKLEMFWAGKRRQAS